MIIAIVGTTVAPWQLFFQQSNVIDKRITPRWLNYERADTVIGSFVVIAGAAALMIAAAFAFGHTPLFGQFGDAGTVANQLSSTVGHAAGDIFAIITLNAAFIGACAVTLASSYAFGDVFNMKHSLHRRATDARGFYITYAVMVVAAAGVVLTPGAPLGIMVTAVQALAGILLPSATVFLLILCNDRAVLGPWVNRNWLNAVAAVILGVLVGLSMVLTIAVLLPQLDAVMVSEVVGVIVAGGLVLASIYARFRPRIAMSFAAQNTQQYAAAAADAVMDAIKPHIDRAALREERVHWRMPPLGQLSVPEVSRIRLVGMIALRGIPCCGGAAADREDSAAGNGTLKRGHGREASHPPRRAQHPGHQHGGHALVRGRRRLIARSVRRVEHLVVIRRSLHSIHVDERVAALHTFLSRHRVACVAALAVHVTLV